MPWFGEDDSELKVGDKVTYLSGTHGTKIGTVAGITAKMYWIHPEGFDGVAEAKFLRYRHDLIKEKEKET